MPSLAVQDLRKTFGKTIALDRVNFEVCFGETLAILGPSGCGKSTLLNIIAGLEHPDEGEVLWEGKSLANVPPHLRGFGLMFQDYALFPHQNVYENVAFGLRIQKMPSAEIQERVIEMLELVDLPGFERRDVNTLSGGEAQRVALARSLAPRPRLLMLDEPLGALDRDLRNRLSAELRRILKNMRQTAVYVTHDQEEAFTLADRVIILNAGRVEQTGLPQEIYQQPSNLFVARFLGLSNLLAGTAAPAGSAVAVTTALGTFTLPAAPLGEVTVLIRPDRARVNDKGALTLRGTLIERSFRGPICRTSLLIQQTSLSFDFPAHANLPNEGEEIEISLDPAEAIQVFQTSQVGKTDD